MLICIIHFSYLPYFAHSGQAVFKTRHRSLGKSKSALACSILLCSRVQPVSRRAKTIAWQEPDTMLLLAWSRHYSRFVRLDGSTTRDVWEGRHYFICDEASFWELHCNPERKCSLLPDRQNVGSIREQIVRIFSQLFGSNSKLWVLWVCFQYVITLRGFLASQPVKNLRTLANTLLRVHASSYLFYRGVNRKLIHHWKIQ